MPGWSPAKRQAFEKSFYVFLDYTYIDSKDTGGRTCLGKHITWGQRHFITCVLDGLEQDIHDFYILKSRQLGLSTISRALSTFYLGAIRGLRGATPHTRSTPIGRCTIMDLPDRTAIASSAP